MPSQLVPSINVSNLTELKEKINILKDLTNYFHLDIAEKEFTGYYETWHNPAYLDFINERLFFDLHLMLYLKPQQILKWSKANVRNLIVHPEASSNFDALLKMSKKLKKKIFIAWSPDISFDLIEKYLDYINGLLILGVKPGKSGQELITETYDRLNFIRNLKLSRKLKLEIMVDGGINVDNLKKICQYLPDFIILGSAIYNQSDPRKAFLELNTLIKTLT